MARNELIQRSFMLMNFGAAALLLGNQWQNGWNRSASVPPPSTPVAVTTPAPTTSTAAQPPITTLDIAAASVPTSVPISRPHPKISSVFSSTVVSYTHNDTVRLVVDLSDRQVYVYHQNQVQSMFPVAIGQPGWETPTGNFQVTLKEQDPIWQHPITGATIPAGPNNPLGTRWIGFTSTAEYEIGFHGTNQPESVGQAVSHGCLRMYDADARKLFDMVQIGTPVLVRL